MADEPENLTLAILRRLETKVDRLSDESAAHTRALDILQQDTRLIRAAVNDIARTNVTSGEVEALHHDVNRVQAENATLAAKVATLERLVHELQEER
jgi:cell division protein FtsB